MALLDRAINDHGPLDEKIRRKIVRYLSAPNERRWEDIHCIIISDRQGYRTVWQAVVAVDPTFQTTKCAAGWARIPDAILVARAIRAALNPQGGPTA